MHQLRAGRNKEKLINNASVPQCIVPGLGKLTEQEKRIGSESDAWWMLKFFVKNGTVYNKRL